MTNARVLHLIITSIAGCIIFIFTTFATTDNVKTYVDLKHEAVKSDIQDIKERLGRIEDLLYEIAKQNK